MNEAELLARLNALSSHPAFVALLVGPEAFMWLRDRSDCEPPLVSLRVPVGIRCNKHVAPDVITTLFRINGQELVGEVLRIPKETT